MQQPYLLLPSLQLDAGPSVESTKEIPEWVKGVFTFWVNGEISDDEFEALLDGIHGKGGFKTDNIEKSEVEPPKPAPAPAAKAAAKPAAAKPAETKPKEKQATQETGSI